MDLSTLKLKLNRFNQSELFYQSYYEAGKNHMIEQFLDHIDMDFIKENNIIIPELTQTIPVEHDYLDSFFFDMDSKHSICLQKHNCFSPPLLHQHTFFECIYVMEGTCTQSINGTTVMMRTGDICLIPPGVKHTISVFDKSIIIRHAQKIEIRCNVEDFAAELDGDAITSAPLQIELHPVPINFLA